MIKRALAAEFLGTFAFVLAVVGTAMIAVPAGAGISSVPLAAGLAILVMGYAVGHISGGHFNPAVTLGLVAGGRFEAAPALGYILAQVAGGLAAAALLLAVTAGAAGAKPPPADFTIVSNAFGQPSGYSITAALLLEAVATGLLVLVFVGSTSGSVPPGFAPIAIGLSFAILALVLLPVTGASMNPARSTATALIAGGGPLLQLWLFWVAPVLGAVVGGLVGRWLFDE